MLSKIAGAFGGLVLVFAGWEAFPLVTGVYPPVIFDQPWPLVSRAHQPNSATLDILFIGNSFTFTAGMPAMLVNMASSDRGNPVQLRVWTVTEGGADLTRAWDRGKAAKVLASHHFDYVVLNEQSVWPFTSINVERTHRAVEMWAGLIERQGARPVLFETWADGDGSGVYGDGPRGYLRGQTPGSSQRTIARATADLARAENLAVAPVGDAFERARGVPGAPDLYGPDRHHPSKAGAYLSAATFYRFFTGRSLAEVRYRPLGLSDADAGRLAQGLGP